MHRFVEMLKLALPKTTTEIICDAIGIAGVVGMFVAGQIGLTL